MRTESEQGRGAVEHQGGVVTIGCRVRIRSVRERRSRHVLPGIEPDDAERVVTIVPPRQTGLHKLSPRMPLGAALLGHHAGEIVPVSVEAGTVRFEILAVEPGPSAASEDRPAQVGDVVHVQDGELRELWRIVHHEEADAQRRLLSEETPMARAILGHRAGEVVRVVRPGGRAWPVTILAVDSIESRSAGAGSG